MQTAHTASRRQKAQATAASIAQSTPAPLTHDGIEPALHCPQPFPAPASSTETVIDADKTVAAGKHACRLTQKPSRPIRPIRRAYPPPRVRCGKAAARSRTDTARRLRPATTTRHAGSSGLLFFLEEILEP